MNSEEKGGSKEESPSKGSPPIRANMSGVESVDTAAVTEDGDANASNNRNPPSPIEVAPVMEFGEPTTADQTDTTPAPRKRLTKIERLLDKMETRRENRLEVSFRARIQFIDICLEKVGELGGNRSNAIPIPELRAMRDEYAHAGGELGEIFERAVKVSEEVDTNVFYFRDFNEYYLTLKENYFRRNPSMGALAGVLTYYIISLILFCGILGNNSTCPRTVGGPAYEGWLSALYFASVTISTVGYGDVSVIGSGTEVWRALIGILYMIFAMVVAVTVFSSFASKILELSGDAVAPKLEPILDKFTTMKNSEALVTQLRRVWLFKIFELALYFFLLNFFGMFVSMIILGTTNDGDKIDWSWMTAFYWAVQTTTTIGYGDLDMPFDLRWFNVFFAIIGTTFAASLLGSMADLKSSMQNMRTLYVWKNREVSMQLIADMEGDGDNQLDEYEFLIGSLITLEKIQREDVEKIMDKFRELAGDDQVIDARDIEDHQRQMSTLQISSRDIERYNSEKRNVSLEKRQSYWQNVEMRS